LKMTNPSTHLYAWSVAIHAASKKEDFDCILVPSEIVDMVTKKHGDSVKVGTAVSQADFEKLTIKQLQKLAQNNSISIVRTKKDFIELLKHLEPENNLDLLLGAELKIIIEKHKVETLHSKAELINLLKQKLSKDG